MPLPGWGLVFDIPDDVYTVQYHKAGWPASQAECLWNIKSAKEFLKQLDVYKLSDNESTFAFGVWCLLIYAQSLWVGPDLTPTQLEELPKFFGDKDVISDLSIEGELLEALVDFPGALYVGRSIMLQFGEKTLPRRWWIARSALMLHRSLAGGIQLCDCLALMQECISSYVGVLQQIRTLDANVTLVDAEGATLTLKVAESGEAPETLHLTERLLLEALSALSLYGFGDSFRGHLEERCSSWPYAIELTGRCGIRRVHQQEAIPQLSVIVTRKGSEAVTDTPFPRQKEVPRDIGLGDIDLTNDILSRPKFVDGEDSIPLGLSEKFYLLAWANERLGRGNIGDDIAMSVIGSLTAEILRSSHEKAVPMEALTTWEAEADWCLWGNALYTRSRAEFNRAKTKERSCLQILALEEQILRPSPPACDRLRSLWLTCYPNKWELRREVGRKFRDLGAPLTARDMYAKMHMWIDVIECLVSVNRMNEAREIVDDQLEREPLSPTLWFLKGQVSQEGQEGFYLKSWELSGHRYYKATNALAHYYLKEASNPTKSAAERDKAIEDALLSFKHTVALKPHMVKTQFTYGCLLMEREMHSEAMSAFNAVLLHEGNDNYQVWANMGAIHCRLKNWVGALKCFQQAARLAQNKWRIWDSYVKVCFVLGDSLGALEGLTKLVDLGNADQIQVWMLAQLLTNISRAEDNSNDHDESRDHLSARVARFFQEYFLKLSLPLPSRRNWDRVENAFDSEQIIQSLDRFKVWLELTTLLKMPDESLKIVLKYFREVARELEDCLSHECPSQFRNEYKSYREFIEKLCERWSDVVSQIYERLSDIRVNAKSPQEYEDRRIECARLIETSEKRLRVQIDGCSLLSSDARQQAHTRVIT